MDADLYNTLRGKIQSLDNTATRMTLPEGTSSTTMENRILIHIKGDGMKTYVFRVVIEPDEDRY